MTVARTSSAPALASESLSRKAAPALPARPHTPVPDIRFFAHVVADALVVGRGDVFEGYDAAPCANFLASFLEEHQLHLEFVPRLRQCAAFDEKAEALRRELELLAKDRDPQDRAEADIPDNFRKKYAAFLHETVAAIQGPTPPLLIGGTSMPEQPGHTILYEWKRQPNGKLSVTIYNTGEGTALFHAQRVVDSKSKIIPIVTFADIEKEKVDLDFIKTLYEPSLLPYWHTKAEKPIEYCYEPFLRIGATFSQCADAPYITPQRAGTCSWKSFMAFLHSTLGQEAYKKLHLLLKKHCFVHRDDVMKNATSDHLLLERDALSKFAASLIKLYRKKSISYQEYSETAEVVQKCNFFNQSARAALPAFVRESPLDSACFRPMRLKTHEVHFGVVKKRLQTITKEKETHFERDSNLKKPFPYRLGRTFVAPTLASEIEALERYVQFMGVDNERPIEAMVAICDFFLSTDLPKIDRNDVWATVPKEAIPVLMKALDQVASFTFRWQDELGDEAKSLTVLLIIWTIQTRLVLHKGSDLLQKRSQDTEALYQALLQAGNLRFYEAKVHEQFQEAYRYLQDLEKAAPHDSKTLFESTDSLQEEILIDGHTLEVNGDLSYLSECLRVEPEYHAKYGSLIKAVGYYFCAWETPDEKAVSCDYYLLRNMAFRVGRFLKQKADFAEYEQLRKAAEITYTEEPTGITFETHNTHAEEDEEPLLTQRLKRPEFLHPKMGQILYDKKTCAITEQFPNLSRLETERLFFHYQSDALTLGNLLSFFKNYDHIKAGVDSTGKRDYSFQNYIEFLLFQYEMLPTALENNPALADECEEWIGQAIQFFLAKFDYETALFFIFLEESTRGYFRNHPFDIYAAQKQQRARLQGIIKECASPSIAFFAHLLIMYTFQIDQETERDNWTREEAVEFLRSYFFCGAKKMPQEREALFQMLFQKAKARLYEMWPHFHLDQEVGRELLTIRLELEGIPLSALHLPLDIEIRFPHISSTKNGITLDLLENELELQESLKEGLPESILDKENCPAYSALFGSELLAARKLVTRKEEARGNCYLLRYKGEEYRMQLVGHHSAIQIKMICKKIGREWYRYSSRLLPSSHPIAYATSDKLFVFNTAAWLSDPDHKQPHALVQGQDNTTIRLELAPGAGLAYKAAKLDPKKYLFVSNIQKQYQAPLQLLHPDLIQEHADTLALIKLYTLFSALFVSPQEVVIWGEKAAHTFQIREIELPTLKLHFDVREERAYLRELPGFSIDQDQAIPSLKSFSKYLVLRNNKNERRLLIRNAAITKIGTYTPEAELQPKPGYRLFEVRRGALFTKECLGQLFLARLYFALGNYEKAASFVRDAATHARPFSKAEEEHLYSSTHLTHDTEKMDAATLGFELLACTVLYKNYIEFQEEVEPLGKKLQMKAKIIPFIRELYACYNNTRNNVPQSLQLTDSEHGWLLPLVGVVEGMSGTLQNGSLEIYTVMRQHGVLNWNFENGLPEEIANFCHLVRSEHSDSSLTFSYYQIASSPINDITAFLRRFQALYQNALKKESQQQTLAELYAFHSYSPSFLYQALLFVICHPERAPTTALLVNDSAKFFKLLASRLKTRNERYTLVKNKPPRQTTRPKPLQTTKAAVILVTLPKFKRVSHCTLQFADHFQVTRTELVTAATKLTQRRNVSKVTQDWIAEVLQSLQQFETHADSYQLKSSLEALSALLSQKREALEKEREQLEAALLLWIQTAPFCVNDADRMKKLHLELSLLSRAHTPLSVNELIRLALMQNQEALLQLNPFLVSLPVNPRHFDRVKAPGFDDSKSVSIKKKRTV